MMFQVLPGRTMQTADVEVRKITNLCISVVRGKKRV